MSAMLKDSNKKSRIIKAALDVFAQEGLQKGTVDIIARKAGVAKGTVYGYFPSKEALFEGVLYDFFLSVSQNMKKALEQETDPVRRFDLMVDLMFDQWDYIIAHPGEYEWIILYEIFLYILRKERQGGSQSLVDEIMDQIFISFEPLFETIPGQKDDSQADLKMKSYLLFSALDGITIYYFLLHSRYEPEQMRKITKDFVKRGLGIAPAPAEES
jgi:AcrR family transcriptional regulator